MGLDIYSTVVVGLEFINDTYGDNFDKFVELYKDKEVELYDTDSLEDIPYYEATEIVANDLTEELGFEVEAMPIGSFENNMALIISESEQTTSWKIKRISSDLFISHYKYMTQLERLKESLKEKGYTWDKDYCGLLLIPHISW